MAMDNNMEMHNVDIVDFIKVLDTCKGDVLNLKSKLCQMIGLSTILKGCSISEAVIRCANPDDEEKLFRFNLYKEMPKEN